MLNETALTVAEQDSLLEEFVRTSPVKADVAKTRMPKLQTAAEFVAGRARPRYLIKHIVQQGRIFTITAPPGAGKTSLLLRMSFDVAWGMKFAGKQCKQGAVVYLAGENPDDISDRVLGLQGEYKDADGLPCVMPTNLHVTAGTFDIQHNMELLRETVKALGGCVLVVVDTMAAFNTLDDENDAKMGKFVHDLRPILEFEGNPTVMIAAHPKKGATKDNMEPRGSSAIMGEIDGNYVVVQSNGPHGKTIELSPHSSKFRGRPFEPVHFALTVAFHPELKDEDDEDMPTVVAQYIPKGVANEADAAELATEDKVLDFLKERPHATQLETAKAAGISERTVNTCIGKLVKAGKLKVPRKGQYKITQKGMDHLTAEKDSLKTA